MDCSSARFFLQLTRPGTDELQGAEAAELEGHLALCSACNHLAQDLARLDQHLGRAMRDLEVPRGLKDQLLLRLAADRAARQRRWVTHALRGCAAAAAVLLLLWGWNLFHTPRRPVLAADDILHGGNVTRASSEERANDQLRLLRTTPGAPSFVNYAYLKGGAALAILPGTESFKQPVEAPQLVFADGPREAILYCVPRGRYDIHELENPAHGYTYHLEVYYPEENSPDDRFVYFVLYTGGNWNHWLKVGGIR
ncbi:MAG: hypothetical protein U0840_09805 [Gemmataceae bacterium]